jgi:ubiquinone/menaquinone biosynthesis C-methylase UbiE
VKMITPEEFRGWNEGMVRKYDPDAFHHHSNPIIRWIERKRVNTIFKMVEIQNGDRILEIGCGAGNVIERASRGTIFGVDLSIFILTKAKQNLKQRIHLFQGDAHKLPCKDHIFSHLICSEVLEHLLDPSSALREMARILRPQGLAIISIPNELWINRIKAILIHLGIFQWFIDWRGGYREMPERMDDEWHIHSFHLEEWLPFFKRDFRITRLRAIPFRWFPLRFVIRLETRE